MPTDLYGDPIEIEVEQATDEVEDVAPPISIDEQLAPSPIPDHDDEYYLIRRMAKANLDNDAAAYGQNPITLEGIGTAPMLLPNLITSLIKNLPVHNAPGVHNHAPAIDIDVPCELVESSQLGHYHLYFHKAMTWDEYLYMLAGMVAAGIVEQGYYNAAASRGYTSLRPVGHVKVGLKSRFKHVLRNLAILRTQHYILKNRLEKALMHIEDLESQLKNG